MSVWQRLPAPLWALAPMEDVTDTVFRRVVGRRGRPHLYFTEFARAATVARLGEQSPQQGRPVHDSSRLRFHPDERPIIAQLWGIQPQEFATACTVIEQLGFDGVDINMGCSVRKIRRTGGGAALIGDPSLAAEIIAACHEATNLPVSVKTRIGLTRVETEQWCGFLLGQNIAALTVHGRLAAASDRTPADWSQVAIAVALRNEIAPETRLLGNGDARSIAHARTLIAATGCDGVMFGRATLPDPWLFAAGATSPSGCAARLSLAAEHIAAHLAEWGPNGNYQVLKKFMRYYLGGVEGAGELLCSLYAAASHQEALARLAAFGQSNRPNT